MAVYASWVSTPRAGIRRIRDYHQLLGRQSAAEQPRHSPVAVGGLDVKHARLTRPLRRISNLIVSTAGRVQTQCDASVKEISRRDPSKTMIYLYCVGILSSWWRKSYYWEIFRGGDVWFLACYSVRDGRVLTLARFRQISSEVTKKQAKKRPDGAQHNFEVHRYYSVPHYKEHLGKGINTQTFPT